MMKRKQFVELLELEDDDLLGVLMDELEAEAGEVKFLVEKIRAKIKAFVVARV